MQGALYVPVAGQETAINTPNLLSGDKKQELRKNKNKKLYLDSQHFFPCHHKKGNDGNWKLKLHDAKGQPYHDMENYAYAFPPPCHAPRIFIEDEYFSNFFPHGINR